MPELRFDSAALQAILDAELASGNAVAAITYRAYGHLVVDLRSQFQDAYPLTLDLCDVALRGACRMSGTPASYGVDEYSTANETIAAPDWPGRYQELARKARAAGRVVSAVSTDDPPLVPLEPYDGTPRGMEMERRADAARVARAIERELRAAKMWSETPPPPEAFQFRRPFGMDTMAFEQWMQFVLLPRLREMAAGTTPFPKSSHLAPAFVREYDGHEPDAAFSRLTTLVHQLDELINGPGAMVHLSGAVAQRPVWDAEQVRYFLRRGPWIGLALAWTLGVLLFAASGSFARISPWRTESVMRQYNVGVPASRAWQEISVTLFASSQFGRVRIEDLRIAAVRPLVRPRDSAAPLGQTEPPRARSMAPLELRAADGKLVGFTGAAGQAGPGYDAAAISDHLKRAGATADTPEMEQDVRAFADWLESLAGASWDQLLTARQSGASTIPIAIGGERRWIRSGLNEWQSTLLAMPLVLLVVVPCFWMLRRT